MKTMNEFQMNNFKMHINRSFVRFHFENHMNTMWGDHLIPSSSIQGGKLLKVNNRVKNQLQFTWLLRLTERKQVIVSHDWKEFHQNTHLPENNKSVLKFFTHIDKCSNFNLHNYGSKLLFFFPIFVVIHF